MTSNDATEKLPDIPSLMDIKKAIPEQLFQSDVLKSFTYVFRSSICALALGGAMYWIYNSLLPNMMVTLGQTQAYVIFSILLALYWFIQGTVFWGIFTLGHDCGHGSFSRYHYVNWIMGLLLHTFILVPYDSWRMSHRHHHKHTGDLDQDEIFYPHRIDQGDVRWPTRLASFSLGGAWFTYLVVGYPPRKICHFNVNERMWGAERYTVVVSLFSLIGWCFIINYIMYQIGVVPVLMYYLIPIYVFASWLVLVTFLHHNGDGMTWYAGKQWDYVRGNLSSVDRDYGIFNSIIHNIGTHQIHHLFPIIPHYHLLEATQAFKATYPHLSHDLKSRSILKEFWTNLIIFVKYGGRCPLKATVFSYESVSKADAKRK
jgi:omega-3 fatty acid desaturase (delta-15 desaturase)